MVHPALRPITKEESEKARKTLKSKSGGTTLCDAIREIFQASDGNPEVQERCVTALVFAKRMDNRLRWYSVHTPEEIKKEAPETWLSN